MKKIFLITILILCSNINAGRPVFHNLSRTDLINESSLIISGWPTVQKSINQCSSSIGSWYVHKVLKGDKKFEGQNIMIADHQYKLIEASQKNGKGVSYASKIYSQNGIDKEQSSSYIFLNIDNTGCAELTAVGAQVHRFLEAEIEALLSQDCYKIERGFEAFLSKIPKDCKQESDCKAHYLHPDSCHQPYIGRKEVKDFLSNDFTSLKDHYSSTCQKNWSSSNVCSPEGVAMTCKNGQCTYGVSETRLNNSSKFEEGEVSFGCAPHDALSTIIILKPKKSDYPYFSLNWWGKSRIQKVKGTYFMKFSKTSAENETIDFVANYCLMKGSCFNFKKIDLKMEVDENLNGNVEYKIQLENDLMIDGKIPLKERKNTERIICG